MGGRFGACGMKKLTDELQDLKDWTAYLLDLLSLSKRDIRALKIVIVLALIVVPGGILLSTPGIYHGVARVLSPISGFFPGLIPGASNATDDGTHTGVPGGDIIPTRISGPGTNASPTTRPSASPSANPGSGNGTNNSPTSTPLPTATPVPEGTDNPAATATPAPTGSPTATPVPSGTPTPAPTPTPRRLRRYTNADSDADTNTHTDACADFTTSSDTAPNGPVHRYEHNRHSWIWDFGDGDTARPDPHTPYTQATTR